MAVWARDFRVSAITLDIDNGSLTPIRGIVTASAQSNTEIEAEQSAASITADTVIQKRVRPTIQFSTVDIPSAIAAFGLTGKCIIADVDDEGLAFFGQKQACSGVASGSVHDKYLLKNALVVPNSLTVDHQGSAMISYDVYTRYDGTSAPIVYTQNNALPSVSEGPIGRWTMYELTVASNIVTGKRNIGINFGANVTQEGADSEIYDSVVSLGSLLPVLTCRGVDTSWISSIAPLLGVYGTQVNSHLWLKRRDKGLADTTHIKLDFAGMIAIDNIFNFSLQAPGEASFSVTMHNDGTNAIIAYSQGNLLP